MKRIAILSFVLLTVAAWLDSGPVAAVQPSEKLLPPTTKGYVSVADVDALRKSFEATQLGHLIDDPLMKPFFEDLREQMESKLGKTDVRLSIKIDDLKDVYGGEVALAMIQPDGDEKQSALVLLVDITDHEQQADELLDKIAKELAEKRAQRSVQTIDGVQLTTFVLPKKQGATENQKAFYFIADRQLVAADHEATAKLILANAGRTSGERLADLDAYRATMARCAKAAGDTVPHLRWFVEPFGYAQTVRAAAGGRTRRGTDMLKVLEDQGFSAIQGAGGFVNFSLDAQDIVHRTFIYAPAVNKTGEKYNLAARMLKLPNGSTIVPEGWVPREVANYLSFHWEMKEAFEYSKTLVDEIAGAPVFDDILESLKQDPAGPQIDVREGLVKHLGQRVTFFADYRLPIGPTSERWLLAFQITNPGIVSKTLDKAMEADPDATKRLIGTQKVWEILRQEEDAEVEELEIAGVGFDDLQEEEEEDSAPLLEHAALTVAHNYLIVASHLDFLEDIFNQPGGKNSIDQAKDFVRVEDALVKLGAGDKSLRFFTRTDKAYHTTYELIRQGKMPESETLLGSVLNRMLGPEERGVLREQQIKGDKLPEYEKVRQYFGPAGVYVLSEDDGWFVAGCFLPKQPGDMEVAGPVVSRKPNERR